jgi:hypothetical protein
LIEENSSVDATENIAEISGIFLSFLSGSKKGGMMEVLSA